MFSWLSLALVLGVILWGAYVRASGSGAGCGSHWPTCDGEVIPRSLNVKKAIELFHRITSGLSGVVVLVQLTWGFRAFPKGHPVRRALVWSGIFMLGEVFIGAGIVLLKYVASDQSVGRAVWMAVHLVNTFLLVAAMTLVASRAHPSTTHRDDTAIGDGSHHHGAQPTRRRGASALLGVGAIAILLVGVSGAIAALGDTLFPATSWSAAMAADLSATAHLLVRLRLAHPFIAVVAALWLLWCAHRLGSSGGGTRLRRSTLWLRIAVYAQVAAGLLNLALLAPILMQLLHLLLAQLVWVAFVLFASHVVAFQRQTISPATTQTS